MATKTANPRQAALLLARERRLKLDAERDAKDRRIEEATAAALLALDRRAEAERALEASTGELGKAVRELLAEDVSQDRAAELVGISAVEVRRLARVLELPAASAGPLAPHRE